jgi:hypothetical protein
MKKCYCCVGAYLLPQTILNTPVQCVEINGFIHVKSMTSRIPKVWGIVLKTQ